MLRIVSFRIEPVVRARHRSFVALMEPRRQRGKALDALVAAGGPAALEQHDHARRMCIQLTNELGAQPLHDRRILVVEEVEIVQEARGLSHTEAKERLQPSHRRVQDLHGVAGRQARPQIGLDLADDRLARPPELGGRGLERLVTEQHERDGERAHQRARHAAPPVAAPHARAAAIATTAASAPANSAACGLTLMPAPSTAPDHTRLTSRLRSSQRTTPSAPTMRKRQSRKSRWPACHGPPARWYVAKSSAPAAEARAPHGAANTAMAPAVAASHPRSRRRQARSPPPSARSTARWMRYVPG